MKGLSWELLSECRLCLPYRLSAHFSRASKARKGSLGPKLPLTATGVKHETATWASKNIPPCFQMPVCPWDGNTVCAENVSGKRSDMWNT